MKDGRGGKWENAKLVEGYADYDDNMPHDEYVKWQREIITEVMRVLKDDGAFFYNHKWRVQGGLIQDRSDIVEGFPVRQIIIWQRSGGINFNKGYFLPTYEVIYVIAKKDFKLEKGANKLGDIWKINQDIKNPHPASFPIGLAMNVIKSRINSYTSLNTIFSVLSEKYSGLIKGITLRMYSSLYIRFLSIVCSILCCSIFEIFLCYLF